ncbi:MAG TPA: hypothetical protein VIV63_13135 [Steroidobacteraceae bacterium]
MLVNLRALFGLLVDIVLLRRGPESLPASPSVLAIFVVLNGALSALIASLIPSHPDISIVELIVSPFVPMLWYLIAFSLAKKPERFVQTMVAFFGVNLLFQPVVAPMLAALTPYMEKQDPAMPPPAALSLLFIVLSVWLLIVWVRIVRIAFEWPTIVAFVFVLAQNLVAIFIYSAMFGVSSGKV